LRVFRNDAGKLAPWEWKLVLSASASLPAPPASLSQLTGWWNGVATGDFDGDGRLDIIASNWGRNSKYERFRQQPLRLFHGDLDGNGTVDLIEAYFDPALKTFLPLQMPHQVGLAMPLVLERMGSCESYARSTLEQIHGEELKNAREIQARWLESTVFLNRGDHLEARPLPLEAQMAPAFAVCVGDLDGDGAEDVFLSQNFFGVPPETSRLDAGRGLWLRGDGQGNLMPVPGQASGLRIYGEQRGAALGDYDADGRADLVVGQNAAETQLFRNVGAKAGLRVRLAGPPGNPTGVGAAVRLAFGTRASPLREVQAGSGYWSQNSAVQVLGTPAAPTQITVRWPGGKTVTSPVAPNAREISVDSAGQAKVLR
jgi:hypothetical protein